MFEKGFLLKNELLNLKSDDKIETKCLVALLCRMKVLAYYEKYNKEYSYIPHVLPFCEHYHDKNKYLLLEPFLIRFSSGFLPKGFFCSLVVDLLQNPPSKQWKKIKFDKNYSNVITFQIKKEFYLRLQDKISYLEI